MTPLLAHIDILMPMANRQWSDAGGSPGGLGHFLIGLAMSAVGAYLLSNRVMVVGAYWDFYGQSTFGITLIPLLIGVGLLFFNGRSVAGWLLTVLGALFIFAGILANLRIYFEPTSLFNTLVILIMLVGGLGLIARAVLREYPPARS